VVAALVRRTLRLTAIVFVIHGAVVAFTGGDSAYARLMLVFGLWCAMLFLWVDWRDRRR
jgi:hypothetical protein